MSPTINVGQGLAPTTYQSELIQYVKLVISDVKVTAFYSGDVRLYVSVDGDYDGPGTWEEVSLAPSGSTQTHTFVTKGGFFYFR